MQTLHLQIIKALWPPLCWPQQDFSLLLFLWLWLSLEDLHSINEVTYFKSCQWSYKYTIVIKKINQWVILSTYTFILCCLNQIFILKTCSIKSCVDDPTLLPPEGAVEGRDPGALKMNEKMKNKINTIKVMEYLNNLIFFTFMKFWVQKKTKNYFYILSTSSTSYPNLVVDACTRIFMKVSESFLFLTLAADGAAVAGLWTGLGWLLAGLLAACPARGSPFMFSKTAESQASLIWDQNEICLCTYNVHVTWVGSVYTL